MNTARPPSDARIRPAAVLAGEALSRRSAREPNPRAETTAFCRLAKVLADDPRLALRRVLQTALQLCNAGSAGLSLLQLDESGETISWAAVGGELASQEGRVAPRAVSSCGLCLEAGAPILLSRPERVFSYLRGAGPCIVEELVVPLYDRFAQPLGAFWVAQHRPASRFCAEDVRVMEHLAAQAALALDLLEQANAHRWALALMQSHEAAQRKVLMHALKKERTLCERIETSARAAEQALAYRDAVIHESHHRVKNTLQVAASLLSMHARAASSLEIRSALQASHDRLRVLAKVHQMLCASADIAQDVRMRTLLDAMGEALRQSLGEISRRVELRMQVEDIALAPDDAIPLALLANEAVTNAYRHAFPDQAPGAITVDLRRSANGSMILEIIDDGVGTGSGDRHGGCGLSLIRTFAAQLHGALAFSHQADGRGTTVRLTIDRGAGLGIRQPESTRA